MYYASHAFPAGDPRAEKWVPHTDFAPRHLPFRSLMSGGTFPFRSRFPWPLSEGTLLFVVTFLGLPRYPWMGEACGDYAMGGYSRCGRPHYCLPYQTLTYSNISQRLCLGDGHRSAHPADCATADASLQREVRGADDLNKNHIPPAFAGDLERTLEYSLSGLVQRPAPNHLRRRPSLA